MNGIVRSAAGLLVMLATAATAVANELDAARNLAATCSACHGTNGRSAGINASLAGMPKEQLVQTLGAFKRGEKPATVMHQLARGYSDVQIEAIASYLAAQR